MTPDFDKIGRMGAGSSLEGPSERRTKQAMSSPHFRHEKFLLGAGVWPVAGVDEAGRGPLAGPVSAAAVILDPKKRPRGLDDSKKLTSAARAEFFELICERALAIGVGLASVEEIDRLNIRNATFLAMRRALQALAIPPAHALIDGNASPRDLPCPAQAIVKGDAISLSISAASIIAKVTRDRLMERLHDAWPHYGFKDHMGYGTPAHLAALKAYGYGLLIHDGYRPWFVTRMFWDATPDYAHVFVADPAKGSRHNRGCAVDLTLYELKTGQAIEMTGQYDEMSPRSFADYRGGTSRQRWLRDLLRREMEAQGFSVYPQEWWHFDYSRWADYGIGTASFSDLARQVSPQPRTKP